MHASLSARFDVALLICFLKSLRRKLSILLENFSQAALRQGVRLCTRKNFKVHGSLKKGRRCE